MNDTNIINEIVDDDDVNVPLIIHDEDEIEFKDGNFPKTRHIFALIGFFGFAIVYGMRVNLSISIISMVNHTAINTHSNKTLTDECPIITPTNSTIPAVSIT
jgi:hypothetical protein